MQQTRPPRNRNAINLALDLAVFVAFLVAMAPRFNGIAVHEWLSIAFAAPVVAHLLLHWAWIVQISRRFLGKVQWNARINYVLNATFFVVMTIVIFSGLMFSEDALPLLGIQTVRGGIWHGLHEVSANLSVFVLGLHVALHWQWIVNAFKRFVLRRAATPSRPATRRRDPQSVQWEKQA